MKPTNGAEDDAMDSKSSATKLLARRRELYQKQEEYEAQKNEAQKAELRFKDEEDHLRALDIKMQDSMIKFSMYLQKNMRQQEQSKRKIADETNKKRELEQEQVKKEK